MTERENDRDNYHTGFENNAEQSRGFGRRDLEHSSPTDSRADEKVIVNHRPGASRNEHNNKKEL